MAADVTARDDSTWDRRSEPEAGCTPLLSVVTAMYNAEATVERTLASLRHIAPEHRGDMEAIVVDDGSTDRGPEIVSRFIIDNPDLKIVLLSKPNGGSASARNVGLDRARGTWMWFLDADDELALDPLPHLHASGAGEVTAIGFSVRSVVHGHPRHRKRPSLITPRTHLPILTAGNPFFPPAIVFRRETIRVPFDERLRTLEDWVFWLHNPGVFRRMVLCPNATIAAIHIHGKNKSSRYAWRGGVRVEIAQDFLQRLPADADRTIRHNLLIQMTIGRLQQGKRVGWREMLRLPANPLLYAKLWIYWTLRSRFGRFDAYGRAARQNARE